MRGTEGGVGVGVTIVFIQTTLELLSHRRLVMRVDLDTMAPISRDLAQGKR